MYPDWSWLLFLTVFVWLLGVSFFIWQQSNFLKSLFPKSGERDIRKKFEEVLEELSYFKKDLGKLDAKVADLERAGLEHMQKVALIRYNPYDDAGGDQSFSFVLLDDKGNGVVVTSLHARSGTRVFAKPVIEGQSSKYQFSKEEEEVIKKAMKNG